MLGKVIPFSSDAGSFPTVPGVPICIVQVGRDPELSRLRAKVLTSAGYSVRSITPEESTAEWKMAGTGVVWIFCHTIEFYELALIAVAIRRARPEDRLLRMIGLEDVRQAPGLFDELLQPIEGVDGLLLAVRTLSTP